MERLIGYKIVENVVYELTEMTTPTQIVSREQWYTWFKHIGLIKSGNAATLSWKDYLGNPLPYEPVDIRITGESALGESLEPFEGNCDDGIIDLSGYVAGDKLLIETLNENVENAKLEVVV